MKLKDKVAIVTGSSRGIGKAVALAFAREGATVIIAARTKMKSRFIAGTIYETADEIHALGGRAFPIKTDVADEKEVEKMVGKTIEKFKRVDILVNNAATNRPVPFKNMPLQIWDAIIRVGLRGTAVCTKAVLPKMMEQKEGHVINISSMVVENIHHEPFTGLAYDVSKAAINSFTRGLAEELKDYRISVNALMPDNTETEGWSFLNKTVDKSDWQKPEMWGSHAVFVATQNPAIFTGKILSEEKFKTEREELENV